MKVKVSMVMTKHKDVPLRTATFTGDMKEQPVIGGTLRVTGRGLTDRKLMRIFETSAITNVVPVSKTSKDVHTLFSVYRVSKVARAKKPVKIL